jgi:hypothetical protein
MLWLELDVQVAAFCQRPDTFGVVGFERLNAAEESVEPLDGAGQVAHRDTSEQVHDESLL